MSFDIRNVVNRCLAGQESAMVELMSRFQGQVFGLCYRMLRQRQDAEDAVQETFVRAFRSLKRWDSSREFEPWLLAIAGNRCRTSLAKRSKHPPPRPIECTVEQQQPDPEPLTLLEEEVDLALSGMREEYSRAFSLFHEKNLSYVEIADHMKVPIGTVKTWVHRARREMVRCLSEREVVWNQHNEV